MQGLQRVLPDQIQGSEEIPQANPTPFGPIQSPSHVQFDPFMGTRWGEFFDRINAAGANIGPARGVGGGLDALPMSPRGLPPTYDPSFQSTSMPQPALPPTKKQAAADTGERTDWFNNPLQQAKNLYARKYPGVS